MLCIMSQVLESRTFMWVGYSIFQNLPYRSVHMHQYSFISDWGNPTKEESEGIVKEASGGVWSSIILMLPNIWFSSVLQFFFIFM